MLKPLLLFGCFASLLVCWGGCGPSSIVLNHEQAGQAGAGGTRTSTPAAETGGSSATSGDSTTSGGSAAGGTGRATGGTGASFSGAATGGSDTAVLAPNCDYVAALKSCNELGCHAATYPAAGLNLVADSALVGRLKDVPATFGDIPCADGTLCGARPAACPPVGTTLLVNSADWQASWMILKMRGTAPGCGDVMPGGSYRASGDQACIEQMVQAIADLP